MCTWTEKIDVYAVVLDKELETSVLEVRREVNKTMETMETLQNLELVYRVAKLEHLHKITYALSLHIVPLLATKNSMSGYKVGM